MVEYRERRFHPSTGDGPRGTFARKWVGMVVALVLAIAVCPAHASDDAAGLRDTLARHLAAINARDLDALLSTVTEGERLTTILPNGAVLETRTQYRQLHLEWFRESDWRMVFDTQDVHVLGDAGIARVRYDSQSRDASGTYVSKRKAILSLVFAREHGQWRLVYDQNTIIPPTH